MVLLVLLTVGVSGYWLLPRMLNGWTRELAVQYLGAFTGGRATVQSASFSLFGGIELRGVSLDVLGPNRSERLLDAETVVLRHRPWSLLTQGRLEPTELVCIAPTVTLEYDTERGRNIIEDLIAAARRGRSAGGPDEALPAISIREVRLRLLSGVETQLNISMVPTGRIYKIHFEERRDPNAQPMEGTGRLDLATGHFHLEQGEIPSLAYADTILPARYVQWRRDHELRGKVVLTGEPTTAPAEGVLKAKLQGVSLRLQPAEGGLHLEDVEGTLRFSSRGVRLSDLTGRIPKAGNAGFELSGRYDGFDANSAFQLDIRVRDMVVPDASGATDRLADILSFLHRQFGPSGRLNIDARIRRAAGGEVRLTGRARPQGMSFVYRLVPYPLEQTTGTIEFETDANSGQVTLKDVRGRRGRTVVTVNGTVDMWRKGHHDVTVSAEDLPLDAELRAALPDRVRAVWDRFRPGGRASGVVRVRQDGRDAPPATTVTLELDGKASAAYEGFPYRLEGLTGRVAVEGPQVRISSLVGRRGPMQCTIDGTLGGLGGEPAGRTDLTIVATKLPLDANLVSALPPRIRPAAASIHAVGLADEVQVSVRQSPGSEADVGVVARVRDVTFRPDAFPLRVDDAAGTLKVVGGRLEVDGLRGRYRRTPVSIRGQFVPGEKGLGLILNVSATGLAFDEELPAALPADVRRIWRKLSPTGRADVAFAYRNGVPGAEAGPVYTVELKPRGMGIVYEEFPYALRLVSGEVVATRQGVRLTDLIARHGKAELVVKGDLRFGPDGEAADLSVTGQDVPLDQDLLGALPSSLAPLARRFRPGGRCSLDLDRLRYSRRVGPPTASRPASAPAAGGRGEQSAWSVHGKIAFREATLDVGLGHKTLSGALHGGAEQDANGLAVQADMVLESVQVGHQGLTDLRAVLRKQRDSDLLRLDKLTAKAHKGKVAGFAEVRLADTMDFGVSLSVTDIDLADLVGAGVRDPRKRLDVSGVLTGNLQLTARGGPQPLQQASGVLRIRDGKLYRMPVMLGLLHVVYLTLPGDSPFTGGTVTYDLKNDTLVFREIHLHGRTASIVGSGTVDRKTEKLDLKFVSGAAKSLPRLGSLSELLEGIAREVAEIHITGTLDRPRIRTLPLRNLDRLLHDLLNPGAGK